MGLFWARSFSVGDQWTLSTTHYVWGLNSNQGIFWVYFGTKYTRIFVSDGFSHQSADTSVVTLPPIDRLPNDDSVFSENAWGATLSGIVIPAWKLVATIVLIGLCRPLGYLESHIKQLRLEAKSRRRGFCEKCGYDLRATPERCPECGAVSPPASQTINRNGARGANGIH